MAFILQADQKVNVTLAPKDAYGNAARIDSTAHKPEWSSSDPTVLTATPAEDGLSCVFSAVGPIGTAQGSVKADVDMGDGVSDLVGTIDFEVVSGQAVDLAPQAGTPTTR